MGHIDIFKHIPAPETYPESPEELEKYGAALFREAKKPKVAKDNGLNVGKLAVDGSVELPFVRWERELPDFFHFTLLDRHETAGGFALIAFRARARREALDTHVYIFGGSGTVNGIRRVIDAPLATTEFQSEIGVSLIRSQLNLPPFIPKDPGPLVDLVKAGSTMRIQSVSTR